MRKIIGGLAAVCLVGNLLLFQPEIKEVKAETGDNASVSVTDTDEYKTKEVIVKFKDGLTENEKEKYNE